MGLHGFDCGGIQVGNELQRVLLVHAEDGLFCDGHTVDFAAVAECFDLEPWPKSCPFVSLLCFHWIVLVNLPLREGASTNHPLVSSRR